MTATAKKIQGVNEVWSPDQPTTPPIVKEVNEGKTQKGVILIDKIKIDNKKAVINYHKSTDFNDAQTVYTGKEEVTEEFLNAFENCLAGFNSILPRLDKSKMKMKCLNFTYDKSNEIEKALYSVKYNFHDKGNQVINLNTPQLPIYKDSFDEKTFCISGKDVDALYTVIEFAKKYINGDTRTKQMKLVVDNTDGEKE